MAAGAAALLTAVPATGVPAHAATRPSPGETQACPHVNVPSRVGHIGGILRAVSRAPGCGVRTAGDPAIETPPLLFHGGQVMGTASTGPVIVRPIFWAPSGHTMPSAYKTVIKNYLHDVAAASGLHTNVFATLPEYYGTNGSIRYKIKRATAIVDTNPLPASGCTVASNDTTGIYADGTGYDACLDDAQVVAETDAVITAHALPRNYGHMYVIFLPKHVESCFNAGTTLTNNACTLNHQPTAAYCAYHGQAASSTVYANMPFPAYSSGTGYTCGSDARFPAIEAPNGNADGDTEVSPTSHEIAEAITDPDVSTGWYDSSGYENGDECAYVYGATQGTAGQLYNQVIGLHNYLTQEEFSNADYTATLGGCLQGE